MKKLFVLLIVLYTGLLRAKVPLTESYEKALEIGKNHNRPIALLFIGSDWCAKSQELVSILQGGDNKVEEENPFIFVRVDFPDTNHQPPEVLNQNYHLRKDFDVANFPTVILLNEEGSEITRLGYQREDRAKYIDHLQDLYHEYLSIKKEMLTMDVKNRSTDRLEELYNKATTLQCPKLMLELLEWGVTSSSGVFLPVEKYSMLINSGKRNTEEALSLKETIFARDPTNKTGARLRVALLDFQAAMDEGKEIHQVLEPIDSYIASFGKLDIENLWRLHLVASEYLSAKGLKKESLSHAKESLSFAPESSKQEIRKFIDSLG